MSVDSDWWRRLRLDFEALNAKDCRLIWTSWKATDETVGQGTPDGPPVSMASLCPDLLPSHWAWWRVDDDFMRDRINDLAAAGARALGGKTEDDWYDRLLERQVGKRSGRGIFGNRFHTRRDGTVVHLQSVTLNDVVKHCIGLCSELECRPVPDTLTAQLADGQGDTASPEPVVHDAVPANRKRGRPPILPDLKIKAIAAKAAGGTNKDAAKILYETTRPDEKQISNTHTILRQFTKKAKRDDATEFISTDE